MSVTMRVAVAICAFVIIFDITCTVIISNGFDGAAGFNGCNKPILHAMTDVIIDRQPLRFRQMSFIDEFIIQLVRVSE